jgi:hypothetical protein
VVVATYGVGAVLTVDAGPAAAGAGAGAGAVFTAVVLSRLTLESGATGSLLTGIRAADFARRERVLVVVACALAVVTIMAPSATMVRA